VTRSETPIVLALQEEVRRLTARLEIDRHSPYDGIAARDETIRQLERDLAEARENCAGLAMAHSDNLREIGVLRNHAKEQFDELAAAVSRAERMRALLDALLSRDIIISGRDAILPFESHDQAINHINEARRAALAQEKP
jgi:hypothetical protein